MSATPPKQSSKLASRYAPLAQQTKPAATTTTPSNTAAPSNVKVTKVTEIWKKDGSTTPRENTATTPEQVVDTTPPPQEEPAAAQQPKKRTYVRVSAQPAPVAAPVEKEPEPAPVQQQASEPQQPAEPQQAEPQQQHQPKKRTYVRANATPAVAAVQQPPKDSKLAPVITSLNNAEPAPAVDHQLNLNQALKRKQQEAERLEDIEKQDTEIRKQLEQQIAALENANSAKDAEIQEAVARIQQLSAQNQQLEEQVIQQATELDQLRSNGPEAANYAMLESISQKLSALEKKQGSDASVATLEARLKKQQEDSKAYFEDILDILEKKQGANGGLDQLLQQQKIQFEFVNNNQAKIQDTLNQQFQQMYDIIVLVQTQQVESENQQRQSNQTFEAMHSELKTLVSQRGSQDGSPQQGTQSFGDTSEMQGTIQNLLNKLDEASAGIANVSSQSKTIEQLVETFTHNMIEQHQHYFKKQFDFLEQQWKVQKHESQQLHDDLLARIGNKSVAAAQRNFEPIKDEHHGATDQKSVNVQKPVAQKAPEQKASVKNLANQFANKPAETEQPKPMLTTTRYTATRKNTVDPPKEQAKQPEPVQEQPEPVQEQPKAPTPVEPAKAPTPVQEQIEPKAPTPQPEPVQEQQPEPKAPTPVPEQPIPVIEEPVKQPEPEPEPEPVQEQPTPVIEEPVKQPEPEQPAPKKNMFATLRSIKDKKAEQPAPQQQPAAAAAEPAAPYGQGMLKKARRASTFNRAAQKTVEQKIAQQAPMFDSARSAPTLLFTENASVVTNNKVNTYGVASIAASLITAPPLNAVVDKKALYGINYFEIEIAKLADPDNLDISVALVSNKIKNTSYLGGSPYSYAFDLTGCTVHNEEEEDYGEDMYESDRIGMWLELLPKTPGKANVHFYKNGAHLGIAFESVDVSQDTWYFALHMFYKDDSVKLLTTAKHPSL